MGEGDIRKNLLKADLVECMVALPGQLFTNTQIPACIWFLTKNKKDSLTQTLSQGERASKLPSTSGRGVGGEGKKVEGLRDRSGEVLFIDARNMGYMKDRVLRDFNKEDIDKIAGTFHNWKNNNSLAPGGEGQGEGENRQYEDIPGFCKSATLEEIKKHDYVLTPGRYVGALEEEDDGEPFGDKMARLTGQLKEQFAQSAELDEKIKKNLAGIGYEF